MSLRVFIESTTTEAHEEIKLHELKCSFSTLEQILAFLPLIGAAPEHIPALVRNKQGKTVWCSPAYTETLASRQNLPGSHHWLNMRSEQLQKRADNRNIRFHHEGRQHNFDFVINSHCSNYNRKVRIVYSFDSNPAGEFEVAEFVNATGTQHKRFYKRFSQACEDYSAIKRGNLGIEVLSTGAAFQSELESFLATNIPKVDLTPEQNEYWRLVWSLVNNIRFNSDDARIAVDRLKVLLSCGEQADFMALLTSADVTLEFNKASLQKEVEKLCERHLQASYRDTSLNWRGYGLDELQDAARHHGTAARFLKASFEDYFNRRCADPSFRVLSNHDWFRRYSEIESVEQSQKGFTVPLRVYTQKTHIGAIPAKAERFCFESEEKALTAAHASGQEYWRISDKLFAPTYRIDSPELKKLVDAGAAIPGSNCWRQAELETLVRETPPFVREIPALGLRADLRLKVSLETITRIDCIGCHFEFYKNGSPINVKHVPAGITSYITSDDRLLRTCARKVCPEFFHSWQKLHGEEFLDEVAAWYRPFMAKAKDIITFKATTDLEASLLEDLQKVVSIQLSSLAPYVQETGHAPGCVGNLTLSRSILTTLYGYLPPARTRATLNQALQAVTKNYRCDCHLAKDGIATATAAAVAA